MPDFIVPQQDLAITKWHSQKTGRDTPIITFCAQYDGKLLQPCQLFGDHEALLREAMTSGKPLVLDGPPVHNTERQRWDIKVPRGSGGQAAYRDKFGGRPWTPAGYRGQPMPFDAWWATTKDTMVQAVAAILAGADQLPANVIAPSTDMVLSEARSLVAQYWMAVKDNVTFPEGYTPRVEPAAQAAAAAPGAVSTQNVELSKQAQGWASMLSTSPNASAIDNVVRLLSNATDLTEAEKSTLRGQAEARKAQVQA